MEETEYAFLRSRGLCVVLYDERGTIGFPRLSAEIDVHIPLAFDESVTVRLELTEIDGKQITYQFEITRSSGELAVEGRVRAACCRFPDDKPIYAILIPHHVVNALTRDCAVEGL